jgi:hypothetical protein
MTLGGAAIPEVRRALNKVSGRRRHSRPRLRSGFRSLRRHPRGAAPPPPAGAPPGLCAALATFGGAVVIRTRTAPTLTAIFASIVPPASPHSGIFDGQANVWSRLLIRHSSPVTQRIKLECNRLRVFVTGASISNKRRCRDAGAILRGRVAAKLLGTQPQQASPSCRLISRKASSPSPRLRRRDTQGGWWRRAWLDSETSERVRRRAPRVDPDFVLRPGPMDRLIGSGSGVRVRRIFSFIVRDDQFCIERNRLERRTGGRGRPKDGVTFSETTIKGEAHSFRNAARRAHGRRHFTRPALPKPLDGTRRHQSCPATTTDQGRITLRNVKSTSIVDRNRIRCQHSHVIGLIVGDCANRSDKLHAIKSV